MAIRTILTDEDPLLRKTSRVVKNIDERTKILVEDMLDTLYYTENGIGLAAPQVGVLKRIFVIDMKNDEGPIVFINPEITAQSGEQFYSEGCLSIPGLTGEVRRPAEVTVQATDENGNDFVLEADGLLAVCICHENDHLDGVLFTDKVEGELTSV